YAQHLRIITAELQRIASHLLSFGTYGMDIGAQTPFLYAFMAREKVLDLLEAASGARLLYHYHRIGGVMKDVPDGWFDDVLSFLDEFVPRVDEFDQLLSYNQIFIERTSEVGILPPEVAVDQGVTGPPLRGSGVEFDVRKREPYSLYDQFDFDVPVGQNAIGTVGDCWNRYYVRIQEMRESAKIVRQAIESCPEDGDVIHKAGTRAIKPPRGSAFVRTESARGELGFYIRSDGGKKPKRVKARPPAFCNLSALTEIAPGAMIPDLVAIIGSLDPVFGEVDR
ncbi:MAG: NADH-quinone oxidoreductase subunit D, partial [bacterium]